MILERVKDVPASVRRWVERKVGYKLPSTYELSMYALNPRGRKKRIEESNRELDQRERRLKRVANKMRQVGMAEEDIRIVMNWGRK